MVRSFLRKAVEKILVGTGFPLRARGRETNHLTILAYHNIIPDGTRIAGDQSLHLPLGRFQAQVDFLEQHFQLVGLDEIGELRPNQIKPPAAITFDDAYVGAVTLGIPTLAARGLPATLFVCPGLLEEPVFWWDHLSSQKNGLDPATRNRALREFRGQQKEILKEPPSPEHVRESMRPARIPELVKLAGLPTVSLASHTWGHPNLSCLSPRAIAEELETSREWLKKRFPEKTLESHISFPYGLFNPDTLQTAKTLGFRYFYRIEGGRIPLPLSEPYVLPRLNIPSGMSIEGFELRTSGLLP